jgi:hypothetical protein
MRRHSSLGGFVFEGAEEELELELLETVGAGV